jgi:hypothetical protein
MKARKILLVAALATLAIGLMAASAFAASVRSTATPYGTYSGVTSPNGGYAGGAIRGGMMGNGYSPYNGYASGTNGYGRCMGARSYP